MGKAKANALRYNICALWHMLSAWGHCHPGNDPSENAFKFNFKHLITE